MLGLEHTSALFGTVVVHAFMKHLAIYHHVFLALTISSIFFHLTHDPHIRKMDKAIAHGAFIAVIVLDSENALDQAPWVLLFPLACAGLWFSQSFFPDHRHSIHMVLHIASIVGMHVYFATLYSHGASVAPDAPDALVAKPSPVTPTENVV